MTNSTAPPTRPLPPWAYDASSLFGVYAPVRGDESRAAGEQTWGPVADLRRGPRVIQLIRMNPKDHSFLSRLGASVGLSPSILLARVLTQTCRKVERHMSGELHIPGYLRDGAAEHEQESASDATKVIQRIPLGYNDKWRLDRLAAAVEVSLSGLVARVVTQMRRDTEIDVGGQPPTPDPVTSYHLLLTLLH